MNQFANTLIKTILSNPFYWIVVLSGLFCAIFSKKITGKAGEFWVKREVNKLPKDEYIVYNDLMLQIDENKTTQIDHLVISKHGLFVIETKQWNGYVYGKKEEHNCIYKAGNKKVYINNPLRQNYGHKETLKKLLNLEDKQIIPLVCVSGRGTFKVNSNEIIYINDLLTRIQSYEENTIDNIQEIVDIINKSNIIDKEKRKEHIKHVKNISQEDKKRCPKCGGNLVKRNGKYGEFIGCSNYPRCKFTLKNK